MREAQALAIRTAAPPVLKAPTRVPFRQPGSRTAIQTATGSVAAIFALDAFNRRLNAAAYTLRILNNSMTALDCRVWALTQNGETLLAYPPPFEIGPYSVESREVPVILDEFDKFERAVAEITGDGVHLVVETVAPTAKKKGRPLLTSLVAGLCLCVTTLGATAFGLSLPRIQALAAPPLVASGTVVDAEYAASGVGRLTYVVQAPNGEALQQGTLAAHSGSIPIPIPASLQSSAYTLQLTMQGPLGTDKEVRVLNAQPPEVVYRKSAQSSGVAVDPLVAKIIAAMKNAKLFVAAPVKTTTAPQSTVVSDDVQDPAPPADTNTSANGVFAIASPKIKSGGAIHMRILSPRNGMVVTLTDMQSKEISTKPIGVDQDTVDIGVPRVSVATRYAVVMNFQDGFGQESVVQPITVTP
jgi:hypothetical protein